MDARSQPLPLPFDPARLPGLSDKLLLSHHPPYLRQGVALQI